MSANILVPPALVPAANAIAAGLGWGPANFQGDLAFADDTNEVVWVGLHLTDQAYANFAAALANPPPEALPVIAAMQIEHPATDDDGNPLEFGPTHVAGLCTRLGLTATTWKPEEE
mgnify:CR=1 FL=1